MEKKVKYFISELGILTKTFVDLSDELQHEFQKVTDIDECIVLLSGEIVGYIQNFINSHECVIRTGEVPTEFKNLVQSTTTGLKKIVNTHVKFDWNAATVKNFHQSITVVCDGKKKTLAELRQMVDTLETLNEKNNFNDDAEVKQLTFELKMWMIHLRNTINGMVDMMKEVKKQTEMAQMELMLN